MQLQKVDKRSISELYMMNRQLAVEEGQEKLFTASLEEYSKGS